MNEDAKIHKLEEELSNIQWDIIGLVEVRRKGEQIIQLNSGNLLYYNGANISNGVGFIINKKIVKIYNLSRAYQTEWRILYLK